MRFVAPHRITALALDRTSPLDLGAVTEVFGIDPNSVQRSGMGSA
jgi:hypothetical protein